jgi:magnesium-transporting ATPase (P-type)
MVLVIALLNDGTIMTLSVDRVLPSMTPDSWDLTEIFAYAVAYGLYLTLSTIVLVIVILETNFFQDKFGVTLEHRDGVPLANDRMLHMIVYLQVAIISQALIFVTRSHGFFFMERPSAALFIAFCVAQLVSSIIAAYGNWGFTNIRAISGGWIGIVWVWVCYLSHLLSHTLLTVSLEHHLVPPPRSRQVCHEGYRHQIPPPASRASCHRRGYPQSYRCSLGQDHFSRCLYP